MASDDEMWWEELERAEAEVLSPGSEEVEEFFRRQAVALRSPSSSSVPSSRRWRDLRWRHRMLEASGVADEAGMGRQPDFGGGGGGDIGGGGIGGGGSGGGRIPAE